MLRLPPIREVLRNSRAPLLDELCEDYQLVCHSLDNFRHHTSESERALITEYEEYCLAIEQEVLVEVAGDRRINVSKLRR